MALGEGQASGDGSGHDTSDGAAIGAGAGFSNGGTDKGDRDDGTWRSEVVHEGAMQDGIKDGVNDAQRSEGGQAAADPIIANGATTDSPPAIPSTNPPEPQTFAAGPATPPIQAPALSPSALTAPAISHSLALGSSHGINGTGNRSDQRLGRRSSSSFSSVHFADAVALPRPVDGKRERKDSDSSGTMLSRAGSTRAVSAVGGGPGAGYAQPIWGSNVNGNGNESVDPLSRPSSSAAPSIASSADIPYPSSRLSVSRPILRSRSSEGSSRDVGQPMLASSSASASMLRRDSASGTSTPRASPLISRMSSGDPLSAHRGSFTRLRQRSVSRDRDHDREPSATGSSGTMERLQLRHQRSRTGSLITRGTRTSVVTGGYESSSASDTDMDENLGSQAVTHPQSAEGAPESSAMGRRSNSMAQDSKQRLGSASSSNRQGNPGRSFPDFALDTAASLPHGGGSTSFALNRKRAKSLTINGLTTPSKLAHKDRERDGEKRHTYGMHTPPLPPPRMERGGSDKSINRRRNMGASGPTTGLLGTRSSSRDHLARMGSSGSPRYPHTALPTLGFPRPASQGAGPGGGAPAGGVFSRGPSRMPSHHSTLSARSSTHFTPTPLGPRTPPGPSRTPSRVLRAQGSVEADIPETPSPVLPESNNRSTEVESTAAVGTEGRERLKKDKGKQRAHGGYGHGSRRDGLAASLGLGTGGRDAILTAEQIQGLLAKSDVASALHLSGTPAAAPPAGGRDRMFPGAGDHGSGDGRSGAASRRAGPNGDSVGRQPFLASAPPALTSNTPNDQDKFPRERTISISTVGTPSRVTDWQDDDGDGDMNRGDSLRHRALSNATTHDPGPSTGRTAPTNTPASKSNALAKRRASSRSHAESEGHVAFTHFPRPDHRSTFVESDEEADGGDGDSRGRARKVADDDGGSATGPSIHESPSPPQGVDGGRVKAKKGWGRSRTPDTGKSDRPTTADSNKLSKSTSKRSSLGFGIPESPDSRSKEKDKEKGIRHRSISAIFHFGSKAKGGSASSTTGKRQKSESAHALAILAAHSDERTEQEKAEAERVKKEREAKEAEMRRKEAERREDEEGQERYYRALMQVQAHPHSVKLSDRAKLHLWAYYQHVFDGLENPPRLNPLAVIRWRMRTEEQDDRRHAWEAEHGHVLTNGHGIERYQSNGNGTLSPFGLSRPLSLSPSPLKPHSLALSDQSPYQSSRQSLPSNSSNGNFSSLGKRSRGGRQVQARSRWTYTIDDIEGYKAAEGHVRYFIPPRLPSTPAKDGRDEIIAGANELTALEHPDEDDARENGSSTKLGIPGRDDGEGDESSIGGSIGRGGALRLGAGQGIGMGNGMMSREQVDEMGVITEHDHHDHNRTSTSRQRPVRNLSYLTGSRTSLEGLSRAASRDTDRGASSLRRGHGGGSMRRSPSHRQSHSVSLTNKLMGPIEAVKGQFEKLKSDKDRDTRRQSTSPYPHGHHDRPHHQSGRSGANTNGDGSDAPEDQLTVTGPSRQHRFSPSARTSISLQPGHTLNLSSLGSRKASKAHLPQEPHSAINSAHPASVTLATPSSTNMIRGIAGGLLSRNRGNGNATDIGTDDEHPNLRRGLRGSMVNLRRRGDRGEHATPSLTVGPSGHDEAKRGLAIARMEAAGPLTDEPEAQPVRSQRAMEKSRAASDQYAERARQLAATQRQLLAIEKSLEQTSESGAHYLVEMDSIKQLYRDVVGVDIVWEGLDDLAAAFVLAATAESANGPAPTGTGHKGSIGASPLTSPRGAPPKRGLPHHMRNNLSTGSASGSDSDHLRMTVHRRGVNRPGHIGRNGSIGHTASLSKRPDMLQQAREAVNVAQAKYDDLRAERTRAEGTLRGMLTEIEEIQAEARNRSIWFQTAEAEIKEMHGTIERLQLTPLWRGRKFLLPDQAVARFFSSCFHLFRIATQSWSYTLQLLGLRVVEGWWAVIVRTSLFFLLLGIVLAFTLGGGDGPVEVSIALPAAASVPESVRRAGTWGRAMLDEGLDRVRDTCASGAARLQDVSP